MPKHYGKTVSIKEKLPHNHSAWHTYKDGYDVPDKHWAAVCKKLGCAPEPKLSEKSLEKLEDLKKDLADDGKLNNSHDPSKKSPGRKKKKKSKKE